MRWQEYNGKSSHSLPERNSARTTRRQVAPIVVQPHRPMKPDRKLARSDGQQLGAAHNRAAFGSCRLFAIYRRRNGPAAHWLVAPRPVSYLIGGLRPEGKRMASGLTRNQVPGNRLRVRIPCPPLQKKHGSQADDWQLLVSLWCFQGADLPLFCPVSGAMLCCRPEISISPFQQFTSRKQKTHVNGSQMPVQARRRRRHVEPRLVAEPVEGSIYCTSIPPSPIRWARTSTTRRSSRASTSRR